MFVLRHLFLIVAPVWHSYLHSLSLFLITKVRLVFSLETGIRLDYFQSTYMFLTPVWNNTRRPFVLAGGRGGPFPNPFYFPIFSQMTQDGRNYFFLCNCALMHRKPRWTSARLFGPLSWELTPLADSPKHCL